MRRLSIGCIGSLLLMCAVLVSCSKDKPTENEPVPTLSPIVGAWERTTTKADGVVITPENDQWNIYEEEVITFRSDGTGQWAGDYGVVAFTWHIDGSQIVIQQAGDAAFDVPYTLTNNSLTLFFPSGNDINPDLEFIYTRQ